MRRDDGITLIEVIVATLLLTVLSAIVGTALVGGTRTVARTQAAVSAEAQALDAVDRVTRDRQSLFTAVAVSVSFGSVCR